MFSSLDLHLLIKFQQQLDEKQSEATQSFDQSIVGTRNIFFAIPIQTLIRIDALFGMLQRAVSAFC